MAQRGYAFEQIERRAHRSLGVAFAGALIAEEADHAVALELRDKAARLLNRCDTTSMIRTEDFAHFLGIEFGEQRGRIDQVAEQHGDLPPLARPIWRGYWNRVPSMIRLLQNCLGDDVEVQTRAHCWTRRRDLSNPVRARCNSFGRDVTVGPASRSLWRGAALGRGAALAKPRAMPGSARHA